MVAYWTPQGLAALRPTEGQFGQIHYPSGVAPSGVHSSASGGYGFLDSTWRTFAPQAGVDISQYPRAYMAPPDVQTRVAAITPISNWTCQGCNTAASRLANIPGMTTSQPGAGAFQFADVPDYSNALSSAPNPTAAGGYLDPYAMGGTVLLDGGGFRSGLTPGSIGDVTPYTNFPSYPDLGGGVLAGGSRGAFAGVQDYSSLGLSPDIASLSSAGGGSGDFYNPLTLGGDLTNPATGALNPFGGISKFVGAKDTGGAWWDTAVTIAGDYITKFGLILLALIFIGAGAWALARGTR